MMLRLWHICGAAALMICANVAVDGHSATLSLVGTHFNIETQPGGTFYPGGSLPYQRVRWRTDSPTNTYAVSDTAPNRWYGTEGYALFATTFTYPNANAVAGNASIPIAGNASFQNLLDLPTWISATEIIADRLAGGFAYALIDDPRYITGIRNSTFDGVNYPPNDGMNTTNDDPWVKLGTIRGTIAGRNDPAGNPDRWSFTVGGSDIPYHFRIGVMTDGLDANANSPTSVHIRQSGDDSTFTSQTLGTGNRFMDMTFFDIVGAAAGDTFVISSGPSPGRVAGFSFDVVQRVPEPASLVLFGIVSLGLAGWGRVRRVLV